MAAKTSDWRPGPTVCRCCLAEGCYKDISTEYFWMGKREVYAEMLTDTLNVSIGFSKSGGPNSNSRLICEPCISRLRDASDFKRQVLECEKTFMQHLDPGSTSVQKELELALEEVKIERVKQEKPISDDEDFDDGVDFVVDNADDDDDDLDDQPLMKLATKVPKKEVDLLALLDSTKVTVKRKATASTKAKEPPVKKAKKREIVIKPSASKPSVSAPKTDKKKKEMNCPNISARRNAEVIVKYSTVYPFRLPESCMVCVYCCESYEDAPAFRSHMDTEHQTFSLKSAFAHCNEGYLKADCSNIRCRICAESSQTLESIALHLQIKHQKNLNPNAQLGIQPFKPDKLLCAICDTKTLCLRQLSRHTATHFQRFTCEACGKSYATNSALQVHIKYSHQLNEKVCRRCKSTFTTSEAKRKHMQESSKCWHHVCNMCGQRFISWNAKQIHLTDVHGVKKKPYVCPVCKLEYADRKSCRVHFKLSHTNDIYVCSCCGLKFETKRTFEDHQVTHTKEKLFPCTVCAKMFPRKKNLIQHMWIHSEYKRFECKLCNKKFNQRVTWRHHMKSYHPELVNVESGQNNNLKYLLNVLKQV